MKNTETAGGTRYSEGKYKPIWAPLGGMSQVGNLHGVGHVGSAITNLSLFVTEKDFDQLVIAIKNLVSLAGFKGLLEQVAFVSEYGAEKYAPLDWREGQSYSTLVNSAMRHLIAMLDDPFSSDSSGYRHYGHAAWNILCILHLEVVRPECNDVHKWVGVTAEKSE